MFGFLLAAFDGKKQSLHDKIAGTYVIEYATRGKAITLAFIAAILVGIGIIIFKIALILAAFASLFGGPKSNSPISNLPVSNSSIGSSSINSNNTSNANKSPSLKVYNSSMYGFSFQYDNDVVIRDWGETNNFNYHSIWLNTPNENLTVSLDIEVYDKVKAPCQSLNDKNDYTDPKITPLTISGQQTELIEGNQKSTKYYERKACLQHNAFTYLFKYSLNTDPSHQPSQELQNADKKLFNQVVTTFKFSN